MTTSIEYTNLFLSRILIPLLNVRKRARIGCPENLWYMTVQIRKRCELSSMVRRSPKWIRSSIPSNLRLCRSSVVIILHWSDLSRAANSIVFNFSRFVCTHNGDTLQTIKLDRMKWCDLAQKLCILTSLTYSKVNWGIRLLSEHLDQPEVPSLMS